MEAGRRLGAEGIAARVVNLPSWEMFDAQDKAWKASVLPAGVPRVSVEAGRTQGWERYVGLEGGMVGIDSFGASAPGAVAAAHFGLTAERVVEVARSVLS
jgi:transketolase